MATSDWRWILYFFVRAVDVTPEIKAAFADIFANNGSGESLADESKLFDNVLKLSTTGELPAQAFGVVVPVKAAMRDALEAFIESLPQSRYYATRNVVLLAEQFVGQLLKTNDDDEPLVVPGEAPWDTTPFTLDDVLADLYADRGLLLIE